MPRKRYTALKFMGILFLMAAIILGNEIASSGCEVHSPAVVSPPSQNWVKGILDDMHQFGEEQDLVFLSVGSSVPTKITSKDFMAQVKSGEWNSILIHSQLHDQNGESPADPFTHNLYVRGEEGSTWIERDQGKIHAHLSARMANSNGTRDLVVYHKDIPLHKIVGLENMSYLAKMIHAQRDESFPVHYLVFTHRRIKPKDMQLIKDAISNIPGALVAEKKIPVWSDVESALITLSRSSDPHPIVYWPQPGNEHQARIQALLKKVDPKGRIILLIPTGSVSVDHQALAIYRGQSMEICDFYQGQGEETQYAALAKMLMIIHSFPSSSSADYKLLHKGLIKDN